jgi:peptidyl-dipeptidase Dcp
MRKLLFFIFVMGLAITSCQTQKKESTSMENPFFTEWNTPFGVPPFDAIKVEHFVPAVKEGIKQQEAEIAAIVANSDAPTFENTILAFDKSGALLSKVNGVFGPLSSAVTNDDMQSVARELSPIKTAHYSNISMNAGLFKRIKAVYDKRNELGFDQEQMRVVEKFYSDFERGGANLSAGDQTKLKGISIELSGLYLQFGENLLAETNKNFKLVIDNKEDLAGLPGDVIARAATAAEKAGDTGKWVFTMAKPSWIPFLTFSEKRNLREKLYAGYFMRGDNGNESDNKEIIKKIVPLRDQKAKLLGFNNFAAYKAQVNMAKTPEAITDFLMELWEPSLEMAKQDVKDMQKIIDR